MPPPKGKKTKAEEALDFLSNLDNLDGSTSPSQENTVPAPAPSSTSQTTGSSPRASTDTSRPDLSSSIELVSPPSIQGQPDEEAVNALAFLEAQIAQKRSPLTSTKPTSRVPTPTPIPIPIPTPLSAVSPRDSPTPINVPSNPPVSSGWGVSSLWSSAATAIQSAQKLADEGYKRVRTEGVNGVTGQLEQLGVVGGVDLNRLRKGAEERLGGIVKGVDLEKLSECSRQWLGSWNPCSRFNGLQIGQDLMTTTSSTLSTILNTVAPPISAHETLELWLSHPMVGYAGVEGVVYRAWTRILEQTESGELIVVWSPSPKSTAQPGEEEKRSINPLDGWDKGWERALSEMESVKAREEMNPHGRNRTSSRQFPPYSQS